MRCFFQSLMQYFRDLRLVLSAQSEKDYALVRQDGHDKMYEYCEY